MDIKDIIYSVKKYKEEIVNNAFLTDVINYYKQLSTNKIGKISENEHALAGIKCYTLYYPCKVYMLKNKPSDDYTYRKLSLSDVQMSNLINQMDGIKNNDFIICKKLKAYKTDIYLTFVTDSQNSIFSDDELISSETYNVLLGLESLKFLQHQNLEMYCSDKYLTNAKKILNNLVQLKKILKTLTVKQQECVVIFSGLVYQFLGTIYSNDIDYLLVASTPQIEKILSEKFKSAVDRPYTVKLYEKDDDTDKMAYKKKWFTYDLALISGASDITEMLINPKHHFYFMGIKCLSILSAVKRTVSRSVFHSFIDIYLLKKINNLDFYKEACINNFSIRQGRSMVNNNKQMEVIYKDIKNGLKEWYDIDVSIDYLKEHFVRCEKLHGTIYYGIKKKTDLDIKTLTEYHRYISDSYIMQYAKNTDSLLDIGCGKLLSAKNYAAANIKQVYGIEPSIYSLDMAKTTLSKLKTNTKFTLIHGFGDKPININKQFSTIIFNFSIHYMIPNFNMVTENLYRLSKKGTKIIITYINGSKLLPILKKNDQYQVVHNNDIMWGVYKFNDDLNIKNPKVLFYMKDVYGVCNGSEEPLLDAEKLKKDFIKTNQYKILYNDNFANEYKKQNKFINLKKFQLDITSFHEILVLERI